ncbi:MAG TPA: hypothetical protein VIX20_16110 [Ktedonobacteraceae bacterium]
MALFLSFVIFYDRVLCYIEYSIIEKEYCQGGGWHAGIAALDISLHKNTRLGLFNYIVYPFDSTSGYANQFHDSISNFSNGSGGTVGTQVVSPGYAANAGYDLETGVGTPDIFNFITTGLPA